MLKHDILLQSERGFVEGIGRGGISKNKEQDWMMKKRRLWMLALAGAFLLAAACGKKEADPEGGASGESGEKAEKEFADSSVTRLGAYQGLEVHIDMTPTEEEVQAEIDYFLAEHPDTRPIEGKTVVEEGDTVHIDFVGRLDGEPFQGGSSNGEGYNLTIGSGSFIPGFEEGLIGRETGTTCELPLTFPDPYNPNPDMSGAETVFEVTIHEIVEYVDAKLTDEYVQKNTEYDTVEAYREAVKEGLAQYKESNRDSEKEYQVIQALIDASEFDCAESDLKSLRDSIIEEQEMYAGYAGMELKEYISAYMNMTEEEFNTQVEELALFQLKSRLVIDAVTEAEQIGVTEEEYQEGLESLADRYGAESGAAFEEMYGREMIEDTLVYDKTIDYLVEQAVEI